VPFKLKIDPKIPISNQMSEATDKEMIPVPIGEFIIGNKVPVNLWVRLNEDKFVMIAKTGQPTNKEQLKSYNNKAIEYLWVKRADYGRVAQQSIAIAGIVIAKRDIEMRQKTSVLGAAASTVFTQLDQMGMTLEAYNNAKLVTEVMVHMCEAHKDLAQLFDGLKTCSDSLLSHSMAVAGVAVMIGSAMGWEKRATLEKLSLGGLLHDIGKKTLPKELLKKQLAQMTPEEIGHYETHAYRGMELVQSLGIVPDDIVSIIYEHHENSLGQGFPQRIRDVKIHPLAKVVGLANKFVNLTTTNVNCPTPKNPREAIMYLEHTMGQPFNKECFKALKKIVEKNEKAEPKTA
jgi:putative nucleotidyltransferase with HDIG domain